MPGLDRTLMLQGPRSVSDTSAIKDSDVSFVQIAADELHDLKLCPNGSPFCAVAMWMHTPVRVTPIDCSNVAVLQELAGLRHPNIELILGVVPDVESAVDASSGTCPQGHKRLENSSTSWMHWAVVTDAAANTPLCKLIRDAGEAGLSVDVALSIARDLARALLYLRVRTKRSTYLSIGIADVWYDVTRRRAVLGVLGKGGSLANRSVRFVEECSGDLLIILTSMISSSSLARLDRKLNDLCSMAVKLHETDDVSESICISLYEVILLLERALTGQFSQDRNLKPTL